MTIYSGFSHEKWWFSIAMLVYQRVDQITTNILWMGQRNPNHQLIDVENSGWSHDFWCIQPSQIGGAGFRWPIHSITMKNPEIMKFLPAGDPSKSSIFWGENFHDFPWENILFWGDRPGKSMGKSTRNPVFHPFFGDFPWENVKSQVATSLGSATAWWLQPAAVKMCNRYAQYGWQDVLVCYNNISATHM